MKKRKQRSAAILVRPERKRTGRTVSTGATVTWEQVREQLAAAGSAGISAPDIAKALKCDLKMVSNRLTVHGKQECERVARGIYRLKGSKGAAAPVARAKVTSKEEEYRKLRETIQVPRDANEDNYK